MLKNEIKVVLGKPEQDFIIHEEKEIVAVRDKDNTITGFTEKVVEREPIRPKTFSKGLKVTEYSADNEDTWLKYVMRPSIDGLFYSKIYENEELVDIVTGQVSYYNKEIHLFSATNKVTSVIISNY